MGEVEPQFVVCDVSAMNCPTRADLEHLARVRIAARRNGCEVLLTGVSPSLAALLAITGLDELFRVEPGDQA